MRWPKWLCAHQWRVLSKTVQQPSGTAQTCIEGSEAFGRLLLAANERTLSGTTTWLLACDRCGALAERTVLGTES